MTSLASLLGTLMTALQAHPMCERAAVVETNVFSPDQFFFKMRAEFIGETSFRRGSITIVDTLTMPINSLATCHFCDGTIRRSFVT